MRPPAMNEHGIALVLILWVLALLSVIVGEFCYAMRTEVNITRNFKDQTRAHYIALAGLNMAVKELIRDQVILQAQKSKKGEEEGSAENAQEERKRCRTNVAIPPVSFREGEFRVSIGNESGKINLNGANKPLLKMMVDAFDLDNQQKDIIVDSILDWRDKDDLHRLNGAENDYYNSLPEPYDCKNDDFDSVDELLLVRGVTPELYHGGLKAMVSTIKPPKKNVRKVAGFKVTRVDFNKININAAPREVLLTLPSMTENLVGEVMAYRKEADFRVMSDVCSLVGPDVCNAIAPYITLEMGPFFSVTSEGTVDGGKIRRGVEAVVEVNQRLQKGYRIVQWCDHLESGTKRFSNPEQ